MPKTDFIWDEKLVKEFCRWCFDRDEQNFLPHAIERFKQLQQSKIKEKERIEVDTMFTVLEDTALKILFNKQAPDEKLPKIKAAIEFVINDEQPKADTTNSLTHEYVTKEECERREKEAFYFAITERYLVDAEGVMPHFKYPSFQDYKNSKQSK